MHVAFRCFKNKHYEYLNIYRKAPNQMKILDKHENDKGELKHPGVMESDRPHQ